MLEDFNDSEPLAVNQNELLRRRLAHELEIVLDEIQHLHDATYIFGKFRDLRLRNQRLLQPAPFIEWLVENYVHSIVVGIRKQVKGSGISVSAILGTLERNPGVLTRKAYHAIFRGGIIDTGEVDRQFDQLAGGRFPHVSDSTIRADVDKLRNGCQKIEYLADKRIAHYDTVKVLPFPTFGDIDNAVLLLEEIACKYSVLLRGAHRIFDYSYLEKWDEVLSFPWLVRAAE